MARPDDRLLGTPQTAQEGTDEIIRSQQVRDQMPENGSALICPRGRVGMANDIACIC